MEAYQAFAYVYDKLMLDVDYEEWVNYIEKIFEHYNRQPKYLAELGCGTGNITNRLAQRGYYLIGVDRSEDMLSMAQDKALDMEVNVIYLNHDMKGLTLPTELDAILCICDGFNYITDSRDLLEIFKMVYEHLSQEGLFIFDISSFYKLSSVLANNTFAENHEEVSYIWENYYDTDTMICDMDLTIFIREGLYYRKYEENHKQRAYKVEEILALLKSAGFTDVDVFDAFSLSKPREESERINFICNKKTL